MPRKKRDELGKRKRSRKKRGLRRKPFFLETQLSITGSPLEQLETIRGNPKDFVRFVLGKTRQPFKPSAIAQRSLVSAPKIAVHFLDKEYEDRARLVMELIQRLNLERKTKEELTQTEIRRLLLQKLIVSKHTKNSFSSESVRLIALRIKRLIPIVAQALRNHRNARQWHESLTTLENIEPFLDQCLQLRSGAVSLQNEAYEHLYDAGIIAFSVHRNLLFNNPFVAQEFDQAIDAVQRAYYQWTTH